MIPSQETKEESSQQYATICNLLFGHTESHDIKQLKETVAILMQKKKLQQSLRKSTIQATNITRFHLAQHRHMISGLVDALRSMNDTNCQNSL